VTAAALLGAVMMTCRPGAGAIGVCGGPGDCCVDHGAPGCSDVACCQLVCAIDPFCCETAWDSICAGEADSLCGICNGGGPCGPGAGDCCVADGTPGCDDVDCCALVCSIDPFCCDVAWDGICADEADGFCGICDGGPCGPGAGDCCVANGTPGCDDVNCCQLVCSIDPFCCDVAWDGICANEADDLCDCGPLTCGGAKSGDCCEPSVFPGCDDVDCCALVCSVDAFCCDVAWDDLCAGEAVALCGICKVEPPLNDNCRNAIPIGVGSTDFDNFGASLDGPPVCFMGADIWFEFTAPFTGEVSVRTCQSAGFDTVIAVYDNCGCPAMESNLIECDDDSCGLQSEVEVEVCAGQCYKIQVGGFEGAQGSGALVIIQVVDNDCGEEGGNCFHAHGPCLPWCDDQKCCTLVCGVDPYCCTITWDQQCADQAFITCGDCGGANAGNCFADNNSPGCNDAGCCQTVCEVDAYCCLVEWDSVCADEASAWCEGPPVPCPGEGACRFAHPNPGCADKECCELICSIDPFCCEVEWDGLCAAAAIKLCPNIGGCPGQGDCFVPNGSPGCEDGLCCELVCDQDPFCCGVEWDQLCADAAAKLCAASCGGGGSCFEPQPGTGCADTKCCKAVCLNDPFCCVVQWDGLCVDEAYKICDTCPGDGDCFVEHGTPGCDDSKCCDAVCKIEPFCCDSEWDDECVDVAFEECKDDKKACAGDTDGNGVVDVLDLITVLLDFGCAPPQQCLGDVNQDESCDVLDVIFVTSVWGACP
jgi:hypothetical protein